jgi:acyl phosphate:glycerol-3-phosphate acyltransferase
VALVALTKFISLASIVSALLFPLPVWLVSRPAQPILFASVAAALLIVYRHRGNIARLRAGTEHVFSLRGGNAA